MLKRHGSKSTGGAWHTPPADCNKGLVRELLTGAAEPAGFDRSDVVARPANNLCLVFLRR
jgi:hypothetical protein